MDEDDELPRWGPSHTPRAYTTPASSSTSTFRTHGAGLSFVDTTPTTSRNFTPLGPAFSFTPVRTAQSGVPLRSPTKRCRGESTSIPATPNHENIPPNSAPPSKKTKTAPRKKPRTEAEKMQIIFDTIQAQGWSLGEFIFNTFRSTGRDAKRGQTHAQMASTFLGGRGRYTPSAILTCWLKSADGVLPAGSPHHAEMFSSEKPYTSIGPIRPALTSFALQTVGRFFARRAEDAIKSSSGLHASVRNKHKQEGVTWAKFGSDTISVVGGILEHHLSAAWYLMDKIAMRKPRTREGVVVVRKSRPSSGTRYQSILSPGDIDDSRSIRGRKRDWKNNHRRLPRLTYGPRLFLNGTAPRKARTASARTKPSLADRIGTSPIFPACTAMPALPATPAGLWVGQLPRLFSRLFSKEELDWVEFDDRPAGHGSSAMLVLPPSPMPMIPPKRGLLFDNVQNLARVRDHRIGRENHMNVGMSGLWVEAWRDIDPAVFNLDDKRACIAKNLRVDWTVDHLLGYLDQEDAEETAYLRWLELKLVPAQRQNSLSHSKNLLFTSLDLAERSKRSQPSSRRMRNGYLRRKLPIGGDGLSYAMLLQLQAYLQFHKDPFQSLEIVEPQLQVWHTKWTDVIRTFQTHWGRTAGKSTNPASLGHSAGKIGRPAPSNMKKVDFYPGSQLLYLVLDARMLDCWSLMLGTTDIFAHFDTLAAAKQLPDLDVLTDIAKKLHRTYSSARAHDHAIHDTGSTTTWAKTIPRGSPWVPIEVEDSSLDAVKKKQTTTKRKGKEEQPKTPCKGDFVLAQAIDFFRDALNSRKLATAVADGDVGRLYECLKYMLFTFAWSTHSNYKGYILETIANLELESSLELKVALLLSLLINLQGLPGHFEEGDYVVEFFNRLLEDIVQHKNAQFDDNFIRNVIARNLHHIAELKLAWRTGTGMAPKSHSHTDPHSQPEMRTLLKLYRTEELHSRRLGRQIDDRDTNDFSRGVRNLRNGGLDKWIKKTLRTRRKQTTPSDSPLNPEEEQLNMEEEQPEDEENSEDSDDDTDIGPSVYATRGSMHWHPSRPRARKGLWRWPFDSRTGFTWLSEGGYLEYNSGEWMVGDWIWSGLSSKGGGRLVSTLLSERNVEWQYGSTRPIIASAAGIHSSPRSVRRQTDPMKKKLSCKRGGSTSSYENLIELECNTASRKPAQAPIDRWQRRAPGVSLPPTTTNADTDDPDKAWLATRDTMGTLFAQPTNNDVDAAFKDHLLAVLSLHDAPRAAAAPIPRYSGPSDWQTEAILRKATIINGMGSASGKRPPTPVLAGLPPVPQNILHSNGTTTNGRGFPDSEASYNTALEDDVESSTDTTTNSPSASYNSPSPSTSNNGGPANNTSAGACPTCGHHSNSTRTHNAATSPLRPYPYPYPYPVYARTNPNGTDADFSDGARPHPRLHQRRIPPYPYPYPYTESPGVVPTGGALASAALASAALASAALASAATQGGMDALEELRLLKDQVRDVSRVCNAVATGDLTQKITVPVQGDLMVQLKKVLGRVGDVGVGDCERQERPVRGEDGVRGGCADGGDAHGGAMSRVCKGVRRRRTRTASARRGGVINSMVDNLGHFATEVTRVSRDVGTEGKLGAQVHVEDIEGTWRELTDEVNTLAANLTTQVRGIAAVTSAVAKGDLSKQIDVRPSSPALFLFLFPPSSFSLSSAPPLLFLSLRSSLDAASPQVGAVIAYIYQEKEKKEERRRRRNEANAPTGRRQRGDPRPQEHGEWDGATVADVDGGGYEGYVGGCRRSFLNMICFLGEPGAVIFKLNLSNESKHFKKSSLKNPASARRTLLNSNELWCLFALKISVPVNLNAQKLKGLHSYSKSTSRMASFSSPQVSSVRSIVFASRNSLGKFGVQMSALLLRRRCVDFVSTGSTLKSGPSKLETLKNPAVSAVERQRGRGTRMIVDGWDASIYTSILSRVAVGSELGHRHLRECLSRVELGGDTLKF
ncbi:hypothetical protein B0H16DRAFT_1700968 [Mycena metata]|uniref:DUF6589 domain-containing protein n=2 Tax=Mycena metata TaxID=1033252 RepID=A0AAD7HC98_9AGAR|nr:hypothetical protein B0H16DRAFT_1700968 [Mycena metata]